MKRKERRLFLLKWWQSLTDEQKKIQPVINHTIDLRDLFSDEAVSYRYIRLELKKDINKIDAELRALGVFFDIEVYRKRLNNWWQSLTDEQKKALPIVNKTIDLRDLFSDATVSYKYIRRQLKVDINKIDVELRALDVLFDIELYRKRLSNWWQSLTDEQKMFVPLSAKKNSVDLRELLKGAPIGYGAVRNQLKDDFSKIEAELKVLGVIFDIEVYRERLINWWGSLTEEQKKSVPITRVGTIDLHDLFREATKNYGSIRNQLKKDINKIEVELQALGVLGNARMYRIRLLEWWQSLSEEKKKAVSVSRQNTVNLRELFKDEPKSYKVIRKSLREDIERIDEELRSLGVLFDCGVYKKLLIDWWGSLTYEQKKAVPTVNNTIDLRFLFKKAPIGYPRLRFYLKEYINEIDTELKLLGVLFRVDDEVITTSMRDFISECKANPDLLWDIKLSMKGIKSSKSTAEELDSYFEQFGFVSSPYLAKKLSCKVDRINKPPLLELRKQLNQLLLKHGVCLPYSDVKNSSDAVGADLNYRRIFLKWKNSLTDEEKMALPMIGKVINQEAFNNLIHTESNAKRLPLFKCEFNKFSSEIIALKGIDYKTKKERDEIRKENALNKEEGKLSRFIKLRDKKLVSFECFNSEGGYYEDVRHAFSVASLKATSDSGISNYYQAYNYYCEFLISKEVPPDSSIEECFDAWSLRGVKEYLGERVSEGVLSISYVNTVLSSIRMTLNRLKTIRNFDFNYLPADGFETVRDSVRYKPYSPHERKQINIMLEAELALAKIKSEPYKKIDRNRVNLDDPKIQARVIFEDDCNCIPFHWYLIEPTKGQRKLGNFVHSRRLSLVELYDEWGVLTRNLISNDLGVYILKIAQVLGMNLTPILELELDDYQEHHPLTNRPCLTYWKERSTGEKMVHLDLFNASFQWLTTSQNEFVAAVFDEVIKLTSEARKYAKDDISNRLFITFYKKCSVISDASMSYFYSDLVEKYQLKDDSGKPMILTISRFRPTLVSELIDAGVSIREIQYLLGHSSIYTTMKYLDILDFDRVIKDKARKAIEDIYSNTIQSIKKTPSQKRQHRYEESQIIMKTPLGGCKNIFDPPDFIKKSSFYVKGKPCSQYNKCISCENVMLTENYLPELYAMQRDYLASLESSEVIDTPYNIVVLENLSLLDDILNPETSEFNKKTLTQAKEDSLFIETTILDNWIN
ncbi:tyrosine-type recombinase/integrase [Vibrio amylolyticus]|uniref:tyrosine-type recombinase/integrase n=1 Tax=Vibrio amylolyticus TaxID=2847292 RepID=UPI00354F29FA